MRYSPRLSLRTLDLGPFSFWLSLPQLITWGSVFYTFSLLMTPLEAELGMSRAESSLAFSLALLAEGLMAYGVGRWIDEGRERWVMTLGSLWIGVGLVGHSFVTTVAGFYAAWIWLGLGTAATFYTPAFAVVTRRFPQDFRRAIITLTFLGGLASTVFIPLFAWWMDLWGWRQALWGLAALQFLICAPLHAWLLQDAPLKVLETTSHDKVQPASVREHLRHAPFWLLALFMVLMMSVTSALPAHMIALLQESGLSPAWVIAIPAAIGVIQVLGRLVLFVFERYWDVHAANRWIPTLIPAGVLTLLIGGLSPLASLVFVLLYGLGNGMNTIVKGTAMAQYVSRQHVGQLNGLLGLPIALARAAAPLTLGLLWSPQHGYTLALWWLLLASLLGTAALWSAQSYARAAQH
ncbi:MFS transporter [Limnohabitans sp. 2KL-51]|uniref:MFS transporter n=1 Tax=Limnohabitans sp. 2KL-51 TaxID=1977911 RepID=UPI000D374772|nr:MFS transporter [Limnohabitans sp. 2KL-51]PUE45950.1 MFS transporter [Limnohabitans sp. 2KL-51]